MGFLTNAGPAAAGMVRNTLQQAPQFTPDMLNVEGASAPNNNVISQFSYQMQPGTGRGESLEDIRARARAEAGIPEGGGRQRVSAMNVLGGLADWVAEVGGAKPSYQSSIDAENERARQAEADQMAREEFGLKKQKFGLETRKTERELLYDQNEQLALLSAKLQQIYKARGPEGLAAAWNYAGPSLLGLSPEQTQAFGAQLQADPENTLSLFSGLGAGAKDAEYGTSLHAIVNPETGETRWVQASKGGGVNPVDLPPGFQPDPRVQFLDTGYGYDPRSRNTGLQVAPAVPKTGDPSKGTQFGADANGNPVITPAEGGAMDQELNDKVTELRNLDNGLAALSDVFPSMLNNIEKMARAGSLSGVPAGAVGVDGTPLRGGGTLGAMAYQNIPFLEQATNDAGFSARQQIESQGMAAINTIEPLLRQAQAGNAQLTSRMMDTPKELENLLKQVINTKDYGAAMDAYNRFQARYNEVRRDLAERIKKAEGKTAAGRRSAAPSKATAPASGGGWKLLGTE